MPTIISIDERRRQASEPLLERDRELAALEQCLGDATAGSGGVVLVEAQAGGGKSRLLGAAREIAWEKRMRIANASGVELEREFPFALTMALFDPASLAVEGADELLRRPLAVAARLLDETYDGSTDRDARHYSVIHALFQATQTLAVLHSEEERAAGLAILVDDLQWADRPSLRLLAYLAERVAELPVAIVLSVAPGLPSADPQALVTLRRIAADRVFALAPLGADAVTQVVRGRFPQAEAELGTACGHVSGGNPFLLTELLSAMAAAEPALPTPRTANIGAIVPNAVRCSIGARLESMAPATRAVAEAVAVLGEAASVRRVALLAQLDSERVLAAAGELAEIQLLVPGTPLSLSQPMLGTAIRASLAPFERAQAHLHAARILADEHAGAELIAEHLLEAPGGEHPAAVAALREAAEAALERGEPQRATRLLNRALAEDAGEGMRIQVEAELNAARAIGLLIADDLERALEICEQAVRSLGEDAEPAHEPIDRVRAWAMYEQGRLTEAQAAASAALHTAMGGGGYAHGALAVLARCHIEKGDLHDAESVIAALDRHGGRDSPLRALALDARAQLRLAQHRPEEALQDAMHAGALLEEQFSDATPGSVAWRSSAALAHLALGEPEQARRLVAQELEDARTAGMTRTVIRDLRILGLALGSEDGGIEKLAEAVAIGDAHPRRLEHVRALIDYGAALRRSGRRVAAREPLRQGLDLSHRGGAGVLESRARAELVAAGGRPRRPLLTGIDSLTSSQRCVAELAASGLTTRQVAGALFVTPKTVEFHLRRIYSKLGVSSREELSSELGLTRSFPAARGSGE